MSREVKIAFLGDISLNGDYCFKDEKFLKNVFKELRCFIDCNKVDFVVANLESPLKGDGQENLLKYPRIKTTDRAINALKILSPEVVTIANNHIYDCLEKGFDNTVSWLNNNNIHYIGASKNVDSAKAPYRFSIKGQDFSLFSYAASDTNPNIPKESKVYLNTLEPKKVIKDIENEKGKSFVIISLHWGVEFSHYPSPDQLSMAHSFVDAGASVICGHHSHTLQGYEPYKKGVIFYNLGNCAFADIRNIADPILWTKDQNRGGLALFTVEDGMLKDSQLYMLFNENLTVRVVDDYLSSKILRDRSDKLKYDYKKYNKFWKHYRIIEEFIKRPFIFFFGERKSLSTQLSRLRNKKIKKVFSRFHNYILRQFTKNS